MDRERNPNAPTPRQGVPQTPARRHFAARLNARTRRHSNVNTVIMPWVDVEADVLAIRAGQAVRDGNAFTVNSRTYVIEPTGRLFPRDGDGFHQLSRGAFRALSLYNDSGFSIEVERMLDLERLVPEDREIARNLIQAIEDWRRTQ